MTTQETAETKYITAVNGAPSNSTGGTGFGAFSPVGTGGFVRYNNRTWREGREGQDALSAAREAPDCPTEGEGNVIHVQFPAREGCEDLVDGKPQLPVVTIYDKPPKAAP